MSKNEDLLGKADAFLKRYHPSSKPGQDDVPVLTEVVAEPKAAPSQPRAGAGIQSATPSKADLLDLEQRLKQSILDAVAAHVVKTVEEPLRARVDAHLQSAVAGLSTQIKTDLETLIREAVARAVAAEIARLKGPPRGG